MIKTFFKMLLLVFLYMVLFILGNALLPFSAAFKAMGASGDSGSILFMVISSAWTCFAMYFIIRHSPWRGIQLSAVLFGVLFFVQYCMTQIETLFFGYAFQALSRGDILLIIAAGILPLLATVPLGVKFFADRNAVSETFTITPPVVKRLLVKLAAVGVIYLAVYMFFGYFVAWQFEELRYFYTGSTEKPGFFAQLAVNMETNKVIYPFQILRGILFGLAAVVLLFITGKNKAGFIISVCLVYLCTAIVLIIPNFLFPDMVRIAHLIEMSSSMLVFGIITGNILWEPCPKSPAKGQRIHV